MACWHGSFDEQDNGVVDVRVNIVFVDDDFDAGCFQLVLLNKAKNSEVDEEDESELELSSSSSCLCR